MAQDDDHSKTQYPYRRPRDAATLLIVRKSRKGAEVLLGQRSAKHVFFPNHYVFPGGGVDRADGFARAATPLRDHVASGLEQAANPHRARAIALAAIRETFEETGLIIGETAPNLVKRAPRNEWSAFYETGMAPSLDGLAFVLRAVTPPGRPRRFDARFLAVDAERVTGDMSEGTGELLKLHWFTIEEAAKLKIRDITVRAIREVESRLALGRLDHPDHPIPWLKTIHGARVEGAH